MTAIQNSEPSQIRAGETISFTNYSANYPPADWNLKYKIVGTGGVADATVTKVVNGFSILFTVANTKLLAAGTYTLHGWVEKGEGEDVESHVVYSQLLNILADLSSATVAIDTRSASKKILDQITTAITEYTIKPVDAISIAGRTFQRPSLLVLQKLHSKYVSIVNREVELTNRANGIAPKRILGRFGSGI